MLKKLYNRYWQYDPGMFRLKHAFKTVLGVSLSVFIFIKAGLIIKVLAGFAAALSVQGVYGERWQTKLISLLIADITFMAIYFLGAISKPFPIMVAVVFVILAFFVMYMRRFGQRYVMFPVFAWVFCFLATILPQADVHTILLHELVLIVVFIVSGMVFLLIFPENKPRLFYKSIAAFLSNYSASLQWLQGLLKQSRPPKNFPIQIRAHKQPLAQNEEFSRSIAETVKSKSTGVLNRIAKVSIWQFAMMKALSIVLEGFHMIHRNNITLSADTKEQLKNTLNCLQRYIATYDIDDVVGKIAFENNVDACEKSLQQFQQCLSHCNYDQQEDIVALLNINLGLRIILKNLKAI